MTKKEEEVGKASQELTNLTREYNHRSGMAAAKERRMLSQAWEINTLLAKAFPDTQGVAEEAMEGHREADRELGVRIDENDAWTMEEVIIATEACLIPARQAFGHMRDAGMRMVQNLWSSAIMPHMVS